MRLRLERRVPSWDDQATGRWDISPILIRKDNSGENFQGSSSLEEEARRQGEEVVEGLENVRR